MSRRPKDPKVPQVEYSTSACLLCGKPARTFTSRDVPELQRYLKGEIAGRDLEQAARLVLPGPGCLLAHLCGVSICATREVVR
jgi:hypothetical protein